MDVFFVAKNVLANATGQRSGDGFVERKNVRATGNMLPLAGGE